MLKGYVMAGSVIELTDATFDNTVHNSDVPVLVDFWAPWCGPCKMIAPIIKEIAEEYADKAKICKLDTDEARDSAMEFGISAIPTIILFKDGQVQKKWVGLTSKKDLAEAIDELL
jgi:thioredoxin 1